MSRLMHLDPGAKAGIGQRHVHADRDRDETLDAFLRHVAVLLENRTPASSEERRAAEDARTWAKVVARVERDAVLLRRHEIEREFGGSGR